MKITIPNAVTTRFARQVLVAQKNSPKILFVSGIALMGATVVTACKGTLALGDTLEEIKQDRNAIHNAVEDNPGRYSEREITKLNAYVTAKGLVKITKLYLPSLALGVAAVACLTSSHNQLARRNAGLSAALAATERALDSYRARVREAYGDEREVELWRGERTETVPVLDSEGRETKSTVTKKIGGGYSPYARAWGRDTSTEWSPEAAYNLPKLRSAQEWGTIKLNSRGYLFLNEMHQELGLSWTPAGQQVGWLSKKYGGADGFVDLGVLKKGGEVEFMDFLNGDEEHIWLDFNVDGEIWRNI